MKIGKRLAECVGLWLAEGDNKCNNEITFTNNCPELIIYFHKSLKQFSEQCNNPIRIYSYSKKGITKVPVEGCKIKNYIDLRAKKPYFIWRLASVSLNKKWKKIVKCVILDKDLQNDLLRGFFAGEGNIKVTEKGKSLRIAQKERNILIENILKSLSVTYIFRPKERNYYIFNRENWDKLAKVRIAELHPEKNKKFCAAYSSFKEYHYGKNFIKNNLFEVLDKPISTKQMALKFKRSPARICDVLMDLKKSGKIKNFRVKNKDYWIKNAANIIVISQIKQRYLNAFRNNEISTKQFSVMFGVCWKSSFRRLKELEKLELVERNKNKTWSKVKNSRKVVVI